MGGSSYKGDDGGSMTSEGRAKAHKTSDTLFYGSIASFVAGLLLLMAFASPYWLVSWEDTQSPFKNMGLWEFCFYKFRHPDYQFDKLFTGCHALYGNEYRLIREKLLPGWLMVVQLFVTIALIFSFVGQMVQVALLLRFPLEVILRFEYHFCGLSFLCNTATAALMLLSIVIFGACCWDRDWLLYPNYNYVSWSFAFALFSCASHICAALLMYKDYKDARERKEKNKALIMQMHPSAFASSAGSHYASTGRGSGFI